MRRTSVILLMLMATVATTAANAPPPAPQPQADPLVAAVGDRADPVVAKLLSEALSAAEQAPTSGPPRAHVAMLLDANGMPDLAAAQYQRALELDGTQPRWWYHLGRTRADAGDLDGALEAMRKASELAPDYAPAQRRLGSWLLDLGDSDGAMFAFRKVMEIDPADLSGPVLLARAHLQRGESATAVGILEPIVAAHPDLAPAAQLLGAAYRESGNLERARPYLSGAVIAAPEWPDPWMDDLRSLRAGYKARLDEALALAKSGRGDEAIQLLESLRAEYPGELAVVHRLAEALLNTGAAERALALLEDVARGGPPQFTTELLMGQACERLRRIEDAQRHTALALELNPDSGPAHVQSARILVLTRDWPAAADALQRGIAAGARDVDVRLMLAQVQCNAKHFDEAIPVLQEILRQAPGRSRAIITLAWAKAEVGELVEARSLLIRAADLGPVDQRFRTVADRIDELANERGAAPGGER